MSSTWREFWQRWACFQAPSCFWTECYIRLIGWAGGVESLLRRGYPYLKGSRRVTYVDYVVVQLFLGLGALVVRWPPELEQEMVDVLLTHTIGKSSSFAPNFASVEIGREKKCFCGYGPSDPNNAGCLFMKNRFTNGSFGSCAQNGTTCKNSSTARLLREHVPIIVGLSRVFVLCLM